MSYEVPLAPGEEIADPRFARVPLARGRARGAGVCGGGPHPTQRALRGDPDSRWRRMAETTGGSVIRWAVLLARIYDVLPLLCPACGR